MTDEWERVLALLVELSEMESDEEPAASLGAATQMLVALEETGGDGWDAVRSLVS